MQYDRLRYLLTPKFMAGIHHSCFPTSVWQFDRPNPEALNDRLAAALEQARDRDPVGLASFASRYAWHSQFNLHLQPEFRPLAEWMLLSIYEAATFLRLDLDRYRLSIYNCWAVIAQRHAYSIIHHHPKAVLVGVYYVRTPEQCGNIFFRDPREIAIVSAPPILENTPWNAGQMIHPVQAGQLLVFPGWLPHGVEANESDDPRMVINCNVNLVPVQPDAPGP